MGEWLVQPQLNRVLRADQAVCLEPRVMEVLACLAEEPGIVLSKDEIIQRVWCDTFVTDDVLIRAISELRKVFGDEVRNPTLIRTIPKRGYQLVAQVEQVPERNGSNGTAPPSETLPHRERQKDGARVEAAASKSAAAVRLRTGRPRSKQWATGLVAAVGALLAVTVVLEAIRTSGPPKPVVEQIVQITADGFLKRPFMATDGARIYFSEIRDGHWVPVSVPASGGQSVPVESPFPDTILFDVSPDGSELLVEEFTGHSFQNPLWILATAGGNARRLGGCQVYSGSGAAWSPDGNRIAYAAYDSVYVVEVDGSNPRKLDTPSGFITFPRWSPDGSRLLFNLGESLWGVSLGSGKAYPLLPGQKAAQHLQPSSGYWTADGKNLLFASAADGLSHIWTLSQPPGWFGSGPAEPVRLTLGPIDARFPIAGRQGNRTYFYGNVPRGELCRYDLESGQFVPYLQGISAEMPDFSKDGRWVAYISLPEASLVTSRVDGSCRTQLTASPLVASLPRWSPDGSRIVFMGRTPNQPWGLYLFSVAGRTIQRLTSGETSQREADWSPDGRYLLFVSDASEDGSDPAGVRLLDVKTRRTTTVPGSENKILPRWSPDGRHIVATTHDGEHLVVFDLESQVWKLLAASRGTGREESDFKSSDAGIFWPTWSRDGRYVYYVDWLTFSGAYLRVPLSGGRPEVVIDLDARSGTFPRDLYWGTRGGWCGLAPDDSPLFVLSAGQNEIYAMDWSAN